MSTSRRTLSLICHCGHPLDVHHNAGLRDPREGWAEECCHFPPKGENSGLDADGNNHCQHYIDNTLPDDLRRRGFK
jgi:hypothetical protein